MNNMSLRESSTSTPFDLPQNLDSKFFETFTDFDELPPIYKRNAPDRIFVNRDTRMDTISYVGCNGFFFSIFNNNKF